MMDLCNEDNNLAHWYFMYNLIGFLMLLIIRIKQHTEITRTSRYIIEFTH